MNMDHLDQLIQNIANHTALQADVDALIAFIEQDESGDVTRRIKMVLDNHASSVVLPSKSNEYWHSISHRILSTHKEITENITPSIPVKRINLFRHGFYRYAAAVLLIICACAYLYFNFYAEKKSQAVAASQKQENISPGKNKATLTLADGRKITLDTNANGMLTQQGNAEIVKLADGQIKYNIKGTAAEKVMMNTMSTPRGGQYQVTLPDGTGVWLNAASSITYPTVFAEKERKVKVTGEVYFEVAKNATAPFKVIVNDQTAVEVLGTHFNINAYEDEADIRTTLLEGRVRVTDLRASSQAILSPGMQASVSRNSQIAIIPANIDQVMAWRNGKLNFNGKKLKDAMKEFARWYDIEVVFEKDVPELIFKGKMDRSLTLSQALNGLSDMGVEFRLIENRRRLIIGPEQ